MMDAKLVVEMSEDCRQTIADPAWLANQEAFTGKKNVFTLSHRVWQLMGEDKAVVALVGVAKQSQIGSHPQMWFMRCAPFDTNVFGNARGCKRLLDTALSFYPCLEVSVLRTDKLAARFASFMGFSYVSSDCNFHSYRIYQCQS